MRRGPANEKTLSKKVGRHGLQGRQSHHATRFIRTHTGGKEAGPLPLIDGGRRPSSVLSPVCVLALPSHSNSEIAALARPLAVVPKPKKNPCPSCICSLLTLQRDSARVRGTKSHVHLYMQAAQWQCGVSPAGRRRGQMIAR